MRPSLRFLALVVVGWVGVRATALGSLPGAEMFRIDRSEAKVPPIVTTEFPPIEPLPPVAVFPPGSMSYYGAPPVMPLRFQQVVVPVVYSSAPALAGRPAPMTEILPQPAPAFYSRIPPLDEWPVSRIAAVSRPASRSAPPLQSTPLQPSAIDRIQLSAWALLRGREGLALGPGSLATNGQLGGSQAGARIAYNVTRQIAATFRTTSEVGRRGGEVAAGVRVQPVGGIPVWLTAERRQRLGSSGSGRSAFALFAEGGLYQRPMPWSLQLDAYLQGGVVGLRSRDAFIDGGLTLSRPLFRQFSGGLGVWGGAQPGVYRVDAGPRITMKVRNNVRVHLDYRHRLAGNAEPGSGPAVTLAGDF
jgi:hypothetical protein